MSAPDATRSAAAAPSTVVGDPAAASGGPSSTAPRRTSAGTGRSLLDRIVASQAAAAPPSDLLTQFHDAPSPAARLALWVGPHLGGFRTKDELVLALANDIAHLDRLIAAQVNAILHHPAFQRLEASWRGLALLCQRQGAVRDAAEDAGEDLPLRVRMLSVTKRELFRDLSRAVEFDQSELFKKVYEAEFGAPGGTPYGVMLADYEFTNHPEDLELLSSLSQVAAASFAPCIAAASPSLLSLDDFATLQEPVGLSGAFEQPAYVKWRSLRQSEDARFLGLVLPRILMREPYGLDSQRRDGFRFSEETNERRQYLWGSAAYAFGVVLIETFGSTRWFASMRGFQRDYEGGGLVTGLCTVRFGSDRTDVAVKQSTEIIIDDQREGELSELGFMPLCHCKGTEYSVFLSNQAVQEPKKYSQSEATTNARISAMLQYILCTSRFAHYLKTIGRDKQGSVVNADELQNDLNVWLHNYVTDDSNAPADVRLRYPLCEGRVEVRTRPAFPSEYIVTMHLRPHTQIDQLSGALRLVDRYYRVG